MIDRKKLIEQLETDAMATNTGYVEVPLFQFSKILVLLKEQELVRCKDCKHWSVERINDYNKCRKWINVGVKNFATMGDWFCADGERKEAST